MNPYDFIPLGNPSRRDKPPGHDVLASSCGMIRARLTTLGPFLIAQQAATQNTIGPLGNGKVIPGSSLKGMLRSLAEIIGGGCISLSDSLYPRGRYGYHHASEPQGFRPCDDIEKLCATCRMFGALIGNQSWKGLVEPGEARWLGDGQPRTRLFNVIVGQPKPSHYSFYVTQNKEIRGRKAYHNHPDNIMQAAAAEHAAFGARQTIQVRALESNQTFEFALHHSGLTQTDYELLLYSLFLEPGLAHKLGWGKPMGFGSVAISPIAIAEIDLRARYRRGGDDSRTTYEDEAAIAHVEERTRKLRGDNGNVLKAVRRLFAFPGPNETWKYPKQGWFKDNPTASLEEFNEYAGSTT